MIYFFILKVGKKMLKAEAGFLFAFKIGILEVQVWNTSLAIICNCKIKCILKEATLSLYGLFKSLVCIHQDKEICRIFES